MFLFYFFLWLVKCSPTSTSATQMKPCIHFGGGGVLLQSGESAIVNSTLYLAHRAKLQEHLPEKNVASTVNHQFSGKIELVLHKSFKRTGPK